MQDFLPGILGFLYYGSIVAAIVYFGFRPFFRRSPNSSGGILTTTSGHEYGYDIGDFLYSYKAYGNFHGLDVRLPLEMPHMYLDSLQAGGHKVSAVFDTSQKIVLEGNFSQYFNVFVPAKYEAIALSVLAPDVMQTLQRHAADFDVELYGDHLRVISNHKVLGDQSLEAALLEVAEALLKEIEHRSRSWSENNSMQAIDQDLHVYPSSGIRLVGRYMTWARFWLSVYWTISLCVLLLPSVVLIQRRQYGACFILVAIAVFCYIGLQYFTTSTQREGRFWSRRGWRP
jgi:hypothetical protein